MTFVYEVYRKDMTEEDKKRVASFGLKKAYNDHPLLRANWTIDRERDLVLICTGSGRGRIESEAAYFTLLKNGKQLITIATWEYTEGDRYKHNLKVTWDIFRLSVFDPSLEPEAAKALIKEALAGLYAQWTRDTFFTELPEPIYVKGGE